MSWNGSGNGGGVKSAPVKKPSAKSPGMVHGLVVGGAVVLIGIITLYFVNGEREDVSPEQKKSTQIAEVEADLSERPKAETRKVEETKPEKKPFWLVSAAETNGFSEAMQRKWRHAHYPPPCYTNTTSLTEAPPAYAVFEHSCENLIAAYLTIEAGQSIVGSPVFDDSFEVEFKKSCETPIIVSPDDDEATKQLKQLMIDTKIDLMDRIRKGEKIGDILTETHTELQKLSATKDQIEAIVHQEMKYAETEEELDDVIDAANKMLESKGIAPISVNPVVRRNLQRRIQMLKE